MRILHRSRQQALDQTQRLRVRSQRIRNRTQGDGIFSQQRCQPLDVGQCPGRNRIHDPVKVVHQRWRLIKCQEVIAKINQLGFKNGNRGEEYEIFIVLDELRMDNLARRYSRSNHFYGIPRVANRGRSRRLSELINDRLRKVQQHDLRSPLIKFRHISVARRLRFSTLLDCIRPIDLPSKSRTDHANYPSPNSGKPVRRVFSADHRRKPAKIARANNDAASDRQSADDQSIPAMNLHQRLPLKDLAEFYRLTPCTRTPRSPIVLILRLIP